MLAGVLIRRLMFCVRSIRRRNNTGEAISTRVHLAALFCGLTMKYNLVSNFEGEIELHFWWRLYSISRTCMKSCRCWRALVKRVNSGSVEGFIDQFHVGRSISGHEDNNCIQPMLLSNVQTSVESDLVEVALYVSTNKTQMATKDLPLNITVEASVFEAVPGQFDHGSQSHLHFWPGRSCGDD